VADAHIALRLDMATRAEADFAIPAPDPILRLVVLPSSVAISGGLSYGRLVRSATGSRGTRGDQTHGEAISKRKIYWFWEWRQIDSAIVALRFFAASE
jgi:hypothetical protein